MPVNYPFRITPSLGPDVVARPIYRTEAAVGGAPVAPPAPVLVNHIGVQHWDVQTLAGVSYQDGSETQIYNPTTATVAGVAAETTVTAIWDDDTWNTTGAKHTLGGGAD